ncbi:hypothetical protein HY501_02975 [Candidatus Woesearchaeota archaeon]|nr:hypothetical protein [Candidatus Woesearchaeota archaeon]
MTHLVALLSTGKGTWAEVAQLMKAEKWEKIFLVTNDFGVQNFKHEVQHELVVIDPNRDVSEIKNDILKQLKDKLSIDTGVNLMSGSGKEHTALLAALFSLGTSVRFVTMKGNAMAEI